MAAIALSAARPVGLRAWGLAGIYVLVFLLLDWVSFIRPLQGLNITPWNPQPALAVALLLWNRRWLAVVWFSLLTAELVVRGLPRDWLVALAATAALSLIYAAMARAIEGTLDRSLALATRRDLLRFTAIVIVGALLGGTLYVLTFVAGGIGPDGSLLAAVARYGIGDTVGLLVLLPMLLVLLDPRRRAALWTTVRQPSWWTLAALIVCLLTFVFAREDRDHFKFFYLLLLPVVWAAARLGLSGAVLAAGLTQIGLIVALQRGSQQDLTVFEMQVLMAAVTMTGLLLGVAVDEQERAQDELRRSLRLAAAGQMAAALAHELSQPLTALGSYAQASRLLVRSTTLSDAERLARLSDVSQRMADDALRASEVVKRLREFFRTGSTQLQPTDAAALLDEAIQAQVRRADALGLRIERHYAPALPTLLVDPVQMAVVLRNLMANAVDAALGARVAGQVTVRAAAGHGELRIEVHDNGPGIDAARVHSLFEPGSSDKPGGMGIGLSICRAIVEAHGGQLWAEPGPHGRFCLSLPLDLPQSPGSIDAP